jgi:hypothetical protein
MSLLNTGRHPAWIASALVAATATIVSTRTAVAAVTPVTFAQVTESGTLSDPNVFAYLDNGAANGAELGTDLGGTFGAAVAADFTYLAGAGTLPFDLMGVQDATISMTSSTKNPITLFSDGSTSEKISGLGQVVDVLTITRDTAAAEGAGSRTNLLTMVFTGKLSGDIGGDTPSLSGGTALGNTVTFSSDFVSFADATQEDFDLAFSSWVPDGLTASPTDNFYNTASSASAGTFDFGVLSVSVPEPTSLPLIAAGALVLLGRRIRRGKRGAGLITAAI